MPLGSGFHPVGLTTHSHAWYNVAADRRTWQAAESSLVDWAMGRLTTPQRHVIISLRHGFPADYAFILPSDSEHTPCSPSPSP